MRTNSYPKGLIIAAHQKTKEKHYWLKKLSGISGKSCFPTIQQPDKEQLKEDKTGLETVKCSFSQEVFQALIKLSKKDDRTLHVILAAGLIALLYGYIGSDDIIVGTPIYKQNINIDIINTVLALRTRVGEGMTFKELLLQVRNTLIEATENYSYPLELLPADLGLPSSDTEFPIFDVALLLSNIHDGSYIRRVHTNILFSFSRSEGAIEAVIDYNSRLYTKAAVQTIGNHYQNLARQVFSHVDIRLDAVEILSEEEKRQILFDFNDTRTEDSQDKTLHVLFEEQAAAAPDRIAVVMDHQAVTYRRLNEQANRLAYLLRSRGVTRETMVAVILKPSIDLIASILGILKAGGAYLPIPPGYPPARILLILDDNNVSFLVTDTAILTNHSFTDLANFKNIRVEPVRTASRPPAHFDGLPVPDRSLVDYEKYNRYIGHAMVKNTLSFQGTRGCPYNCSYCHRIWPRTHVVRSAENIFSELMFYYNMGIRRFSFIDDIFNVNIENSTRFFRMIVKNRLKVQLFFPNGLRGDILTRDYIDLMVEAGTVNIDLALETASPRLQKLIGKNLNIDKLKENVDYICQKHPRVILDFNAMYGFPSETEEEAMMTMEFIKSVKWIHFPFVFILKIHPNTGIGKLALQHGISPKAIMRSMNYSYHDVPETLPFPKRFARHFQAGFIKEYFLLKERLLHVLPYQMKIATEDELVQKYNNYLPTKINCFSDIIEQVGISREELGEATFLPADYMTVPDLNRKIREHFPLKEEHEGALRILLLDLSELFSSEEQQILHSEIVEPTGLLYVLTYLHKKFDRRVYGKVAKSRIDFDNYRQLKTLISDFEPHLIGIRTLSYYKDFFHRTVFMIRNWGFDVPIISGGPYASMDYPMMLHDPDVAAAVLGEGELTTAALVGAMLDNHKKFPPDERLNEIQGIAFIPVKEKLRLKQSGRHIVWLDKSPGELRRYPGRNPGNINHPGDLLYLISTSGSTGNPKSVMLEHRNLNNLVHFQFSRTGIDFSRVLQFASIGFDVSAQEIFSTLLYGGGLYLIPDRMKSDIFHLFDHISKNRINTLFLPPAFLRFIFSDPEYAAKFPGNVRNIVTAGEQLVVTETLRSYLQTNRVNLYNHYGPTETHVVTNLTIEPGMQTPELPPIGKPIANTRALILGKHGNLLPVGAPGELYISGDNVGRGYCNRQELTLERFSHDLLDGGRRRYRTGDAARWLTDGNIQFLGRVDQQVKIRGFRIELGEIENRLQNHDEIKRAVVEVVSSKPTDGAGGNENYLCAYIVTETGLDTSELREYLSGSLPDYMIPAKFVQLKQIPLNPSGKIDRNALLRYETFVSSGTFTAPRGETERKLAGIWAEVLAIDREIISIEDDFFDSGGHSLKATILLSKIHKIFNVKLSLGEMFQRPTIKELSEYIKEAAVDKYTSIMPAEEYEYYPVSSAQKRLYILQQMETETIGYNLPYIVTLDTVQGRESLQHTFKKLIKRHESLRTSFEMITMQPVQRVHREVPFEIGYYNPGGNVHPALEDMIDDFTRPFNLSCAPLMRVKLVKTAEKGHILMLDMHHIITDGTSQHLLIREFMALSTGGALPALKLQYKDFSQWQNSEEQQALIKEQESYWLEEFAGELPILNLPFDYPRPLVQCFEGRTVEFILDEKDTRGLKALCRESNITLYMAILSAFTLLLSKLSGQEDIIVGTPVKGRPHADLEGIVGMFVNTLAIRNYPVGDKSCREFLQELKERTLAAFENQGYPFEELVDKVSVNRDTGRNPLFDVMFNLLNQADYLENIDIFPGGEGEHRKSSAKFDLTLTTVEVEKGLLISFEYSTRLFQSSTIDGMVGYFLKLLRLLPGNFDQKLSGIELVMETEKYELLYEFNASKTEYPGDKTIHELFEEQAARTPGYMAVNAVEQMQITYGELNKKSNRLAQVLIGKGVSPDTIVGIMLHRSVEIIIGILGIIKAGGGYLPIDLDYPRRRINYMLADSNVAILLTGPTSQVKVKERSIETIDISNGLFSSAPTSTLTLNQVSSANLVYVIYTSGSTGKPKGVIVNHRNVVRLVKNTNYISFAKKDRILQTGNLSFDVSTFEIWGALLNGLQLYLAHKEIILTPARIKEVIRAHHISTIWMTASLFNQMVDADIEIFRTLTHLLVGGEALSAVHVNRAKRDFPHLTFINGYGPTENTTFSCTYTIAEEHSKNIPIGKPIANSTAYILDKYNHFVPVGVVGELVVGGDGVARGYLNNPELTTEKFCLRRPGKTLFEGARGLAPLLLKGADKGYMQSCRHASMPSSHYPNTPLLHSPIYRTGDLARWLGDGNVEFLGRMDQQVKIRGFRIELGEIENRLLNHAAVKEALVLAKEREGEGSKYLCAYIVLYPSSGDKFSVSKLRNYLSAELPEYMLPSYFVQLDSIPLTPNGKVDRKSLPEPDVTTGRQVYAPPRDEIDKKLLKIWSAVLEIETGKIGIDSNFFEVGGHSLKAAMLAASIHKEFGVKIPLAKIFKESTIRGSSRYIKELTNEECSKLGPVEKREYYALSSAQKRLYIIQQIKPEDTTYNIPTVVLLEGDIKKEKIGKIFRKLIERHESLRTSFFVIEGALVQKIHTAVPFAIEYHDLESGEAAGNREKEITRDFERSFDLRKPPLLRVGLIKKDAKKYVLMIDIHHIITDGISDVIFIEDFLTFYHGEELTPLKLQYKDFSDWQNREKESGKIKRQEEYWLKEFEGGTAVLDLPGDFARPAVQSFAGSAIKFTMDSEIVDALKNYAWEQGATLYMVLLALLYVLFSKLSGKEDIVIGTVTAGRSHADLEKIMGMFVNTLPLRNFPAGEKTYRQFLLEVKERVLKAFDNQDYPFEILVEKVGGSVDLSCHPLFGVGFVLQNQKTNEIKAAGLKLKLLEHEHRVSRLDLTFIAEERGDRLAFMVEYCTKLFEEKTIKKFINYFSEIAHLVIKNGDIQLKDIKIAHSLISADSTMPQVDFGV